MSGNRTGSPAGCSLLRPVKIGVRNDLCRRWRAPLCLVERRMGVADQ